MTLTAALENSEQEFTERFTPFAASGVLYPQREGSPLLEFAAGGRVLYLFDRNGPYARPAGPAQVIVHGVLERFAALPATDPAAQDAPREEKLQAVSVSAIEGCGAVLAVQGRSVIVHARLPLVLASLGGLTGVREGDWLTFRTLPPLHGFTL